MAAARDMLEGRRQHFAEGEDDPFEGMSPQQIQQVMDSQRAALDAQRESERQAQREASASDDPFDVRLGLQCSCAASGTAMQASGKCKPASVHVGIALLPSSALEEHGSTRYKVCSNGVAGTYT